MKKKVPKGKSLLLFLGTVFLAYLLLVGVRNQELSQLLPKKFILLSFDDFDNLIGGKDRVFADHKKAMFNQYRGRYVRWTGEVYEIVKETSGDFILKVQHTGGIKNFDVTVRFDGLKTDKLKRKSKGEVVTYTGKLISFDPGTGYYLEDGELK